MSDWDALSIFFAVVAVALIVASVAVMVRTKP